MLAYKESDERPDPAPRASTRPARSAAFTAAGTSYATHGEPMIPIYIFYSMFGFQRTGDALWAAADQMARGFLIGATAGRTTLTGEGLQHADGHSPLLAATNPAVVAYDPAYGYEIGHIVRDGLRRMYGESPENVIYYLTVYNEPIRAARRAGGRRRRGHPARACTCSRPGDLTDGDRPRGQILASGVGGAVGARGAAAAARRLGRRRRRLVGDVAGTSCAATAWRCDEQAFLQPGAERAGAVRDPAAGGRARPGGRGQRLHARGARTRSGSGSRATTPRSAPTASASPTPARPPAGSSTSTARRSRPGCCCSWPREARSTRRARRRRSRSTGCTTSRPARRARRAARPDPQFGGDQGKVGGSWRAMIPNFSLIAARRRVRFA